MLTGTLTDFDLHAGLGNIRPDAGGDPVPVHLADLPRDGGLRLGDRVEFLLQQDRRGSIRAVEVRRVTL